MFPVPGQVHPQWNHQPVKNVNENKGDEVVQKEKGLRGKNGRACRYRHEQEDIVKTGIESPTCDVHRGVRQVDQVPSELSNAAHPLVGTEATEKS